MKKVSKEEYYNRFMNLDAVISVDISKGYPYTTNWTMRGSTIIIARAEPIDKYGNEYNYFIKL